MTFFTDFTYLGTHVDTYVSQSGPKCMHYNKYLLMLPCQTPSFGPNQLI